MLSTTANLSALGHPVVDLHTEVVSLLVPVHPTLIGERGGRGGGEKRCREGEKCRMDETSYPTCQLYRRLT